MNPLLMIPGPVTLHQRVLSAMSKPMINHRSKEFAGIYDECVSILKDVFSTKNDLFVISGSGTAGMEAAVSNVVDGDDVITIVNGKFGERFKDIAELYGNAIPVEYQWGNSIELDDVEVALEGGAKVVTMVHNETSTGILNPVKEIATLARKYDALVIMDGITSIGGVDVPIDKWGIDIAIAGSQKCVAAPPGLVAISVSERAWERMEDSRAPYYLDLREYQKYANKEVTQTPYTPAVPLFFALHEALRMLKEEGMEERIKRHRRYAEAVRNAMRAMRLELFPRLNDISEYSNTVTAVNMPEGITDKQLRDGVKEKGVLIAGGQGQLSGKIFRIGNMGSISEKEILFTIRAVESVLAEQGLKTKDMGVTAAEQILKSWSYMHP
ncbi:MAG: alanine--glyoxylate aminotransferase family protein [Methanocellales archaeon]|nr:alanine--glyoxylate aminotransferase family protein [Methanocellales archaeon]MDD3290931.1 alanine--glyoxylate aminotransferase family protein [Methanocellales archaeon]MDD3292325.1 alanine--glyoxylate aminotransferase family protein [Methanocellales archaeon]MDD5234816.1 alanine--glyoxylate aminotransferase family protein [Methanocellales archaeon]MDD5484814.1 alanine--glyoxylate aminotransferase family protein [Methanocellales archaeon]